MVKEDIIQFVGLKKLSIEDQDIVQKLSAEYFTKIKRALRNITNLSVHVKTHHGEGKQSKYTFHIRCVYPGRTLETNKHHDFELQKAAHSAFKALLREITHAHHSDTSRPD